MDMAIVLHDGLCWTFPTSICHVLLHETTRSPKSIGAMVVGVCAFSSSLRSLKWVLSKRRYLIPPTRGNASRWAFVLQKVVVSLLMFLFCKSLGGLKVSINAP